MIGQEWWSILVGAAFAFSMQCLLGWKASNWAGMSKPQVFVLINTPPFNWRWQQRVGFPPFFLSDQVKKFHSVRSMGRGLAFFAINYVIGYWALAGTGDSIWLYVSAVAVVEYVALRLLSRYQRRFYFENAQLCRDLCAAEGRLVGKLIDVTTENSGIPVPRDGRIQHLVFQVQGSEVVKDGMYLMHVWLPSDERIGFPWNKIFHVDEVTLFLSSCVGDPAAPCGVQYKFVGVTPGSYAPNTDDDLRRFGRSIQQYHPDLLKSGDPTLDEYVARRAASANEVG